MDFETIVKLIGAFLTVLTPILGLVVYFVKKTFDKIDQSNEKNSENIRSITEAFSVLAMKVENLGDKFVSMEKDIDKSLAAVEKTIKLATEIEVLKRDQKTMFKKLDLIQERLSNGK